MIVVDVILFCFFFSLFFQGSGVYTDPILGEKLCLVCETAWLTGCIQSVHGVTAVKCLKLQWVELLNEFNNSNIKQSLHSKRSRRGEVHFLIPCQKLSKEKKKPKLVFPWFCAGWQLAQISIILSLSLSLLLPHACLSLCPPAEISFSLYLPSARNHFDGGQATT